MSKRLVAHGGPMDGRRFEIPESWRVLRVHLDGRYITAVSPDASAADLGEMPRVGEYREELTREGIVLNWRGE